MGIAELKSEVSENYHCATYVLDGEDHTLGNALRSVISRYPEVTFCGYTIPHPADNKINFRIQATGSSAIDILRRGLNDLEQHCSHIINTFQQSLQDYHAK